MTTNGTAAAWRATLPVPFAVTILLTGMVLAGCESGQGLLGNTGAPPVAVAPPPTAAKTVSVAIAPVLGVPETTSKQIVTELTNGLDKSRFAIVTSPSAPADYTLRGYATAAKDKASAGKLSYFFDVIDKSGAKVNRIAGDEPLAGVPAAGKDIWQSVTPAIATTVASKTASSFAAYVPAGGGAPAPAGPAIASAAPAAGAPLTTAAAAVPPAVKTAAAPTEAAAAVGAATARAAGPATGSIDRPVAAIVPAVTGAPGDGSQTLSAALQKELTKSGVTLSDAANTQAYRVEGKVIVGADKDGKQPIEISWNVKDPQGKKLGTVTQKNEIPQGSLDGAWGKTADAAAAAAAQGILKLLPGQKTAQAQ